jgi:thymidylate kinase
MKTRSLRHVIIEGLPAAGKSELLELLARYYPHDLRILPELVKSVVEANRLDLFRDREALTQALLEALPARHRTIQEILKAGFLCLEESHLGVHYAYALALGDRGFIEAYGGILAEETTADLFIRLDLPVAESIARQEARGTPQYAVDAVALNRMLNRLAEWHNQRKTRLQSINADRPASAVVAELEGLLGLSYGDRPQESAPTLDLLLLLGRPASGKSEFIDFMSRQPVERRRTHQHLGAFDVIDDFPILWQKFEEDDLWESQGRPRLYSRRADGNYAVSDPGIWPFLIDRLDRDASRRLAIQAEGASLIVEFSRGGASGYADALERFSDPVLSRAAILYVEVSFEESWRRNLARYDEKRRSGILTHSVPRQEMESTYGSDDWASLTGGRTSGTIVVRGIEIPFATMHNEPESVDPTVLGPRYGRALDELFSRTQEIRGRS